MVATPDGHVLMFGDSGALAINPALNPNLGYDPIKDFTPITALVTLPTILVVHPDVPAIMVTAYADLELVTRAASQLRIARFLRKPLRAAPLVEAIRAVVSPRWVARRP